MVHNVQSPNRRLNHLRGMHSRIIVGKNSKSYTSIPLWCTKGVLTRFDGAQKSLPIATWSYDCHGTCETLRSAERQGPTDSEPVGLANSTTPLILYRLQKESNTNSTAGCASLSRSDGPQMVEQRVTPGLRKQDRERQVLQENKKSCIHTSQSGALPPLPS